MMPRSIGMPAAIVAVLAWLSLLAGCGGSSGPQGEEKPAESQGASEKPNPAEKPASKPTEDAQAGTPGKSDRHSAVSVGANGRREIDGIPYDVFFDDPLRIAANTQVVGQPAAPVSVGGGPATIGAGGQPAVPPATPGTAPAGTAPEPASPGSSGGGGGNDGAPDWQDIIPTEELLAEVKRIRNMLTSATQSVGAFNQSIFQIPPDAATLAMLAGIAIDHPGDIRWKPNAKYIRDLAAKMVEKKLMQGRASFKQVEEPFLNIRDILDGNPPAGLPESPERREFAEVADFGFLMKRLERAEKWLTTNGGSEASLKENAADAAREAAVIAATAKVITLPGYGYEDDDEFKGYANAMLQAAREMTAAAKKGEFEAFQMARSKVSQACTQCHSSYRN